MNDLSHHEVRVNGYSLLSWSAIWSENVKFDQYGVLIHVLASLTFLAPMEITATRLRENVVEHFYTKEPNLLAIRQFLTTDPKRHLSTLSRSEKFVAGRQAKRFRLSPDGTLQRSIDNCQWFIYPETNDAKQEILMETHKYPGKRINLIVY
jgi:hypothetical protein